MLLPWLNSTVVKVGIGGSDKACSSKDLVPHPGYNQDTKTYRKYQQSTLLPQTTRLTDVACKEISSVPVSLDENGETGTDDDNRAQQGRRVLDPWRTRCLERHAFKRNSLLDERLTHSSSSECEKACDEGSASQNGKFGALLTPSVQSCQCRQVLQPLKGSRGTATTCTQEGEQSDGPTNQNTDPRHTLLRELGEEPGSLVLQCERVQSSRRAPQIGVTF